MNIRVKCGGMFGQPTATVNSGDRYNIATRGVGKIYLEKVDMLSGNGTKDGLDIGFFIGKNL